MKGMHAAPPEIIWRGYGTESRIPKNLFEEYAKGADRLYAYRLENPIRYGKPKTLSDIGLKRAPQSWCYLRNGAGRAGTCNGRTELIYDITPSPSTNWIYCQPDTHRADSSRPGTWLILPNRTWTTWI